MVMVRTSTALLLKPNSRCMTLAPGANTVVARLVYSTARLTSTTLLSLYALDQLRGLAGSSGPSQSTMFGSAGAPFSTSFGTAASTSTMVLGS